MMGFEIAVVIPVLNEASRISSTLDTFANQADKKIVFIIVDNNSTDGTMQRIRSWKRKRKDVNVIDLTEKKRGVMYARFAGLVYASKIAFSTLSTDADDIPPENFFSDFRKYFIVKPKAEIWRGRVRQYALTRLQKMLFVPHLLDLISWQEVIETQYFGPFFFGGYFGIKNRIFSDLTFNVADVAFPEESTVLWAHHCYYLGYRFILSANVMRGSDRRFWGDPLGFIAGERTTPIRTEVYEKEKKLQVLERLKKNEAHLMSVRQHYFSRKLLMLLLDAIFFETKLKKNKKRVEKTIHGISLYLGLQMNEMRTYTNMNLREARRKILLLHERQVCKKLTKKYQYVAKHERQ